MRVYNFGAGPAALPAPVLEKAQAEMLDFGGTGMSIMEMSHRSKTYQAVIDAAEAGIRRIMGVPEDYAVLFLPGGASQQFALAPLNLSRPGQSVNIVHTGSWAAKALAEAKIVGKTAVIWDGKDANYMAIPAPNEIHETPDAAYVHITSNETIGGIQFRQFPKTSAPLVADMSSDIMSRRLKVADFGMIYAGAQKNLGPSGLALVIIRRDLLEICPETVNKFFRYRTHAAEGSMYNTPNTWAIYLLKLVCEWAEGLGGLDALEEMNAEKAAILYEELDRSAFWKPCPQKPARSQMNVTWRLATEDLEAKFVKEATAAGLAMLKGHRSVGGLRASIYNACPKQAVLALAQFMRDFEVKNG
jgi:phosphoserine aminotransferase